MCFSKTVVHSFSILLLCHLVTLVVSVQGQTTGKPRIYSQQITRLTLESVCIRKESETLRRVFRQFDVAYDHRLHQTTVLYRWWSLRALRCGDRKCLQRRENGVDDHRKTLSTVRNSEDPRLCSRERRHFTEPNEDPHPSRENRRSPQHNNRRSADA